MFEVVEENGVVNIKRSGSIVIAMGPVDLRSLRAAIDKFYRERQTASKEEN